jgi:hypothetical protein
MCLIYVEYLVSLSSRLLMWNNRKLLVGAALVLVASNAVAQRSLSVLAGGQLYLMKPRFVDDKPSNFPLNLTSRFYRNFAIGVAVGLSPRYAVHGTVGVDTYGVSFKASNAGATRISYSALEYSLVMRRRYPGVRRPHHVWFTDAGADIIKAGGIGGVNFVIKGQNASGAGFSAVGTSTGGNSYRLGLRLGAGREWAFDEHHYVALGIVASVGLRDIQRYRLQAVSWRQGETIDPVLYDPIDIATRASFVGVQVRYRFQL